MDTKILEDLLSATTAGLYLKIAALTNEARALKETIETCEYEARMTLLRMADSERKQLGANEQARADFVRSCRSPNEDWRAATERRHSVLADMEIATAVLSGRKEAMIEARLAADEKRTAQTTRLIDLLERAFADPTSWAPVAGLAAAAL